MAKHKLLVKKQYKYSKRFKLKEKSLSDQFFDFLDKIKKKREEKKKKSKRKGLNLTLVFTLVFILIIFGLILYFVWMLQSISPPPPVKPGIYVDVLSTVYAPFGTIFNKGEAFLVVANSMFYNADEAYVEPYVVPYSMRDAVPQIFILKSGLFGVGENYFYGFISDMKRLSIRRGIGTEVIELNELDKIPPGSFLVVPSGRFPIELALKFEHLLKKKVNIIYIGGKPVKKAVDKRGELVSISEEYEPLNVLHTSLVDSKLTPEGLHMRNPYYKLTGATILRGAVSFLTYKNNQNKEGGMFFIFPNTLEEGWNETRFAAEDVLDIITDGEYMISKKYNQQIEKISLNNGFNNILIKRYSKEKKLVGDFETGKYVLFFRAKRGELMSSYMYSFSFLKDEEGYLYPTAGPSFLTMDVSKRPIKFSYKIESPGKNQNEKKTFNLLVINSSNDVVDTRQISTFFGDESSFDYFNENLPEDTYLFIIADNANEYVKSLILLSPLEVKAKPDFNTAKFKFEFYVGDNKVVVDDVSVFYEGQTFRDRKVSEITIDLFNYFGGRVPAGYHVFTIKSGKVTREIKLYNPPKTAIGRILFGNPINMALLTISVIIFIVGSFIKPKIDKRFFIDIPDFPPVERLKIEISEDEVIRVIEDVNKYYKWKYTPLRISEIKMGFRRIIRNGNPIIISDFNLEYILEKLSSKGLVKKVLDYYGLLEWEKKSGFSLEDLALFRKLRDICVEHAIPFSQLSSKKYNVKIKLMFKDIFILFFTPKKEFMPLVRKSISLVKKSQVIILSSSNDEKELLLDYLYQSGKEVSLFRYYMERGMISVMTVKEFETMLRDVIS